MYGRTILVSTAALILLLSSCGAEEGPPSMCEASCACVSCTSEEMDTCEGWEAQERARAKTRGCTSELRAYWECIVGLTCTGGIDPHDLTPCPEEGAAYTDCSICPSHGDGVCDEPEGTGLCREDTDVYDCTMCHSYGDGVCDEPEGTGLCPEGSDVGDCVCTYVNDGICNEPDGAGGCGYGTDIDDCNCPSKNDGVCDEPGFTGLCAEGSDSVDCTCPSTNDDQCDEPEGTGTCSEGTDLADCFDCDAASADCASCQGCALQGNCGDESYACEGDPTCKGLTSCLSGCDYICAEDPWPETCLEACVNGSEGCMVTYAEGVPILEALNTCLTTQECPSLCGG